MSVGFDHEGEPVMVKECRVVVEDSIFHTQKGNDMCRVVVEDSIFHTQKGNDIHNEQQNKINKDDEFIVKNLDRLVD